MPEARVLLVNNKTLSLPQLRRRFEQLGSRTDIVDVDAIPPKLGDRYQAVVLSGTKVRAHDQQYYAPLVDLVGTTSVPVFGICGGMQILAVAAGSILLPGPQRVGTHEVRVDKDEAIFSHVKPTVTVFQRHTLYVAAPPHGFRVIGHSAAAPVEFLRSDDGRIFGSQAHVEFRPDGLEILRGFSELYQ